MADPIYTNLCNMRARLPKGAEQPDVGPLPSLHHVWDGVPMVTSWWRPTLAERLKIAAGGLIRVTTRGHTTPPLCVEADPDNCYEVPEPGKPR